MLPGFVEMMNRKADELGADGTHFSNPNGLPEDDHYTTAYDLALFTREALAHEEFRTLAGTQHYEIPPTNLQPQTRRMNNRQYMFCLNDTYPGAFAGKTGWTEEAGNTLITIAERDNVTLTSVVLKSNGVADAEFIDSTNLLDYGYDNFHRVFVPKDGVEDRKVDGGTLVAQEMPVLSFCRSAQFAGEYRISRTGSGYRSGTQIGVRIYGTAGGLFSVPSGTG